MNLYELDRTHYKDLFKPIKNNKEAQFNLPPLKAETYFAKKKYKYQQYELEKKALQNTCKSSEEYEEKIRELIKRLGI